MKVLVIPAFLLFTELNKTKEMKASRTNKDCVLETFGIIVDQPPIKSIINCIQEYKLIQQL